MKSYTDLFQSKKLAEVISPESADYCWGIDDETLHYNNSPYPCAWKDYTRKEYYIPCWSLAALLKILHCNKEDIVSLSYGGYWDGEYLLKWAIDYELEDGDYYKTFADNPIDACVSMIEKLHELNLL
jgi:hypothetical protein